MDKKNDNDKPTGNGMPLQELKWDSGNGKV
jgi:hypothetical protein